MRIARRDGRRPPPATTHGGPAAALAASGVTVRIGRRTILDRVDLEARHGEILALVGPNGAGKSTLLAVLSGDRASDGGTATLDGRPLHTFSWRELARRRAVLPQDVHLSFPFTAREVVAMGRAPWQATPVDEQDAAQIEDAIARVDATGFSDQAVTTLSGGERARVALARVLAQRAGIVLLDEPTAALDLRHQELVLRIAREEAARGVAVVVVLHDLGSAAAHADRVALLGDGRLLRTGPPDEVLTSEALSEIYGCEVEVIAHPRTGMPLVLPRR